MRDKISIETLQAMHDDATISLLRLALRDAEAERDELRRKLEAKAGWAKRWKAAMKRLRDTYFSRAFKREQAIAGDQIRIMRLEGRLAIAVEALRVIGAEGWLFDYGEPKDIAREALAKIEEVGK